MKHQETADMEWLLEEDLLPDHPDLARPVPKDAVPATAIAPPSTLFPTIPICRLSRTRTYRGRFEADISMYCWEWRPDLGLFWERHPTWRAGFALNTAVHSWLSASIASSLGRAFPGETAVQP